MLMGNRSRQWLMPILLLCSLLLSQAYAALPTPPMMDMSTTVMLMPSDMHSQCHTAELEPCQVSLQQADCADCGDTGCACPVVLPSERVHLTLIADPTTPRHVYQPLPQDFLQPVTPRPPRT